MITFTQEIPTDPDFYYYKASFKRLYDADTITLDIDLGFGIWLKDQQIRLWGIDAYEVRGPERLRGLAAKEFAEDLLLATGGAPRPIIIRSVKDKKGKYGRWLAELFVQRSYFVDRSGVTHYDHSKSNFTEWINLNHSLVVNGHAEIVEY